MESLLLNKLKNDENYREYYIKYSLNSLKLNDNTYAIEIEDILNDIIYNKIDIFMDEKYKVVVHNDEDDLLCDYFLPCIYRMLQEIYQNPSPLIKGDKYELMKRMFIFDEYIDFIYEKAINNLDLLENFKYTDKNTALIKLIVDDYIGYLIETIINTDDVKSAIRNLKFKKIIKNDIRN